ncbi:MAG: helix-turn-helix domain-containing protein, partial [Planctomycetota bacterium]
SRKDGRVVRRAQMILQSSQGIKVPAIASAWDTTIQTVLKTIHRFNSEGLASLADKPRSGRPPKATDQYVEVLKQAVQHSPRDLGYPFSSWTLERLREHVGRQTDVLLNPRYLSSLMGKHGIVYRRPKHLMAHLRDPQEYDEKKAILEFLKKRRSKKSSSSNCCTSTNVKFTCTQH